MTKLSFGQKLMLLRKNKKLSQKQLADMLDIGVVTIMRYETGAMLPHSQILLKLSDFFHVPIDYLLKEDDGFPLVDDRELLELTVALDQLPDHDKAFIKDFIRNYLKKSKNS